MSAGRFLIVARHRAAETSLQKVLSSLDSVRHPTAAAVPSILIKECQTTSSAILDTYLEVAAKIADLSAVNLQARLRPVIVVDMADCGDLNPLPEAGGFEALLSMLILSFPEVNWAFGLLLTYNQEDRPTANLHSLMHILETPGADPLFDYSGLRSLIHRQIRQYKDGGICPAPYVPFRTSPAAVVDDERDYAYFHAYTAYRHGYRVLPVTSGRLLVSAFSKDEGWFEPELTFEDLYLNFPDTSKATQGLSDLEDRYTRFPKLAQCAIKGQRIIVTTLHKQENAAMQDYRIRNGIEIVNKPLAGMFSLWVEALGKEKEACCDWLSPASEMSIKKDVEHDEDKAGHSAPGRLLAVADFLISRAKDKETNTDGVPDLVRCAVLVSEAIELLGGKTPTTSLECISLRNKYEAMVECRFCGVAHELAPLNMKERFGAIDREVDVLERSVDDKKGKISSLNAKLSIVNIIMGVFRSNSQFDEEMECLHRKRRLHRELWMTGQKHQLWAFLAGGLWWYVEFLVESPRNFILALILWFFGIGVAWYWLMDPSWFNASLNSATLFFGVCAPGVVPSQTPGALVLCVGGMLAGFFHLGIFITHLYALISRR